MLLAYGGFEDLHVAGPGTTRIPFSDALDLRERVPESVFVEAVNP